MPCAASNCRPLRLPGVCGVPRAHQAVVIWFVREWLGKDFPNVINCVILYSYEVVRAVQRDAPNATLDYFALLEWKTHPHFFAMACQHYSECPRIDKWIKRRRSSRLPQPRTPNAEVGAALQATYRHGRSWIKDAFKKLQQSGASIDSLEICLTHIGIGYVNWDAVFKQGIYNGHTHVLEWANIYFSRLTRRNLEPRWEFTLAIAFDQDEEAVKYKVGFEWMVKHTFERIDALGISEAAIYQLGHAKHLRWLLLLIVKYEAFGYNTFTSGLELLISSSRINQVAAAAVLEILTTPLAKARDDFKQFSEHRDLMKILCYTAMDVQNILPLFLIHLVTISGLQLQPSFYYRVAQLAIKENDRASIDWVRTNSDMDMEQLQQIQHQIDLRMDSGSETESDEETRARLKKREFAGKRDSEARKQRKR